MFLVVDIVLLSSGNQNTFVQNPGGCSSCLATKQNSSEAKTSSTKKNPQKLVDGLTKKDTFTQRLDASNSSVPLANVDTLKDVSPVAPNPKCFCLLTALNFNQLGYFLIANLLTGAVNLSFRTIDASPFTAFLILNLYLIVLNGIIMVLYRRTIMLKL